MKHVTRWIGIWMLMLLMLGTHAAAGAAELDISSSQRDQLKALASNTRDRTGREREALRQARSELVKVYSSYKIDWRKLKSTFEKMSSAQVSLLNIHLDNEIAIRDILNEEQFKKLRDIMRGRLRDRDLLVVPPPEIDILDRLPDKRMLEALDIPEDKQKLLANQVGRDKVIQALRESSMRLLRLYSDYELDSAAARKLIGAVHQNQAAQLRHQHSRQRHIREILTQDQFQKLQQEIAKKMAERGSRPIPKWNHSPRPNKN